MNKILKKYYWILFWIYLIFGIVALSVTLRLFYDGWIIGGVCVGVISFLFLKDWWSIHKNKWRLE